MKEIFEENLTWKGKLLVFTWHFKDEFEAINKPIEFILEILEKGDHHLIGRKQNKYNVFFPYQHKYLCLSYVEPENVILIHIKPIRREK
ncbi:MAG: hypothetical protein ABIH82_04050 [Candidatus Woesearchaeota archaeon]